MNGSVERAAASYIEFRIADTDFSVKLNLDVHDRLIAVVMDGFKAVPRRGLEVGGLLLGRIGVNCILVDDFAPVDSEHLHGPSWLLSDKDKALLAGEISRVSSEASGPRPLGIYRSQTRAGFAASAEDQMLMREFCPGEASVFLLIKPEVGGPGAAAWFAAGKGLWDCPAEFPARRRELLNGGYPMVDVAPPIAPQSPPLQPKPQPEVIRSRMAKLLETAEARAATIAPLPVHAPRRQPWLAYTAILLVSGLAGYSFAWWWNGRRPAAAAAPAPPPPRSSLLPVTLSVTVDRGALHLRWDHKSPLLRSAAAGIVWIDDGAIQRRIDLKPPDLTEGSIQYWPSSDDVRFRMELLASQGTTPPLRFARLGGVKAAERKPAPLARVDFEAVKPGSRRGARSLPAKPLHAEIPPDPAGLRTGEVAVNVRVAIDPAGKVTRADVLSKPAAATREFENLALKSSRLWTFTPARSGDRRVSAKGVLHYKFGNAVVAETRVPGSYKTLGKP